MDTLRIHIAALTILASVSGAAQAQSSRWDGHSSLSLPNAYPPRDAADKLLEKLLKSRS